VPAGLKHIVQSEAKQTFGFFLSLDSKLSGISQERMKDSQFSHEQVTHQCHDSQIKAL